MGRPGEVLVAILNNRADFALARDQHWYRIPVSSAAKWLKDRWPPEWLAFYQTRVFGEEAFAVNYYARVHGYQEARRWQLIPEQPRDERGERQYYQLRLGPLKRLDAPIPSRRRRRIVFIPTTWDKFVHASEINDLSDESPLEDVLWAEFKRRRILAERQEFVRIRGTDYALDFAIYCGRGQLDVETDGDTYHAFPQKARADNRRDNALHAAGWQVLRFNSLEIRETASTYCVETVMETIDRLGGLDEGGLVPRRVDPQAPPGVYQMGLWEAQDNR
jgi:very-short-patch-repair endonuclease